MSKSADLEDIRNKLMEYADKAIQTGIEALDGEVEINFNPIRMGQSGFRFEKHYKKTGR